jgi:hypothetical protein
VSLKTNDKKDDKQHCSDFILKTLKAADQALNYPDFVGPFTYGTIRNNMCKLVKNGKVLRLPKEYPARFILPHWAHRPEYCYVQRNDKKGRVGRFDFLSYLESLKWEGFLGVHDLKFTFMVYSLNWLGTGWTYHRGSRSYSRLFELSYPVRVQCFDTGTVLVHIKCSLRPFRLEICGLSALACLLGEVRNMLHTPCIPDPTDWLIAQWHLNRDSKILQGGGLDIYLAFRDFFDDSAQFYYKHELDKMRAEVQQSPKRTIQEVFENILNRDSNPQGGS